MLIMSDYATRVVVDGALSLLGACSALTWVIILHKAATHWKLAVQDRRFDQAFGGAFDLASSTSIDSQLSEIKGPKARVTRAALSALAVSPAAQADRQLPAEVTMEDRRASFERLLARQIRLERRMQEKGLTLLASVTNVAPFIGLFGTVFGIIHALHAATGNAAGDIGSVAGPVGEALIATGVGIAVAIPAVLAYNAFARRTRVCTGELEDLAVELTGLAERHRFRLQVGAAARVPVTSSATAFATRGVAA